MPDTYTKSRLKNIPGWLLLMGLITALGPLAIDMYLPAFSAIAKDIKVSHGHIERTLAVYLFGLSVSQLFYGPLADRYGRKNTLLFGLVVFILASIGCASATNINHLLVWRTLQAFGGAAGMVIPRAVIRDRFDTRDASKALSVLILVMGATPILAPILGAQVLVFAGWRWIFHIMTVAAGILFFCAAFNMKETLNPEHLIPLKVRTIFTNYKELIQHKKFVCYTLAGGFGSAGMFAYIAGSPRIFIDIYGIDPRYFGLLFGINAAALIFMSQVSARMLNRHNPEVLLKTAQKTLVAATLIALALTLFGWLNLTLLMLCLIGFMASQGFVSPNAAALALREQGRRLGVSSALMGALHMLCGATAGLIISIWQTPTALPLTGLLAACAALSWLFGRIALKAT